MRIAVKTLVFLLVISVIAAQTQPIFLFAGSASEIGVDPTGQYQPVVPVGNPNNPYTQSLSTGQAGMLAVGTEETIKNIVSFSPPPGDNSIEEQAQESSEVAHSLVAAGGSYSLAQSSNVSSRPTNQKTAEVAQGDQRQNQNLISKPLRYEHTLLGTRDEGEEDDQKTASDNTVDFFSGSALSAHQPGEDEKPSLEKALRAIFNQKLENLYVASDPNDLPDEKTEIEGSDYIVVDVVNFTRDIRLIHQLLNPPERLHPWLKWLLYLGRVTPQMLEIYYGALEKRDQIFKLAFESAVNGDQKYKIRYRGKIMKEFPVYVMPEDAQGFYELVRTSDDGGNALTAQGTTGSQP